jgi:hypothetical protein
MTDLRTDQRRMAELVSHLVAMEGVFPYLYCDHVGLVTIAIGFLVDQRGASDAVGENIARQLATRPDVTFTRNGAAVGAADVGADWRRVKARGRTHPNSRARDYRTVAQLRISDATVRNLTNSKILTFANALYQKRPFILRHDPRVAMALVDARYNPAGVPLYTAKNPNIPKMWNALNPQHRDFNPAQGLSLFESTWATKSNVAARYIQRHFLRVQWMYFGLQDSGML